MSSNLIHLNKILDSFWQLSHDGGIKGSNMGILNKTSKAALNKAVEKSANTLAEAIDATGKVVKANAKELAMEVIVFKGYISSGLGLIAALALGYVAYLGITNETDEVHILFQAGGVCAAVASLVWAAECIHTILMARFAPRLFLISYAARLLKSPDQEQKK